MASSVERRDRAVEAVRKARVIVEKGHYADEEAALMRKTEHTVLDGMSTAQTYQYRLDLLELLSSYAEEIG